MSKRGRRNRPAQRPHEDQYAAKAAIAQAKQAAEHAKYMENLRTAAGVKSTATKTSTPQSTSEESPQ
jgi:hypothetical protein